MAYVVDIWMQNSMCCIYVVCELHICSLVSIDIVAGGWGMYGWGLGGRELRSGLSKELYSCQCVMYILSNAIDIVLYLFYLFVNNNVSVIA